MVDSLEKLNEENIERLLLAKNAEILSLQNQINAHFMYNVLETIKMMAEIKEEYDALAPEFAIIQALIDARKQRGITQKELSERTGISQGDISKLENGNGNPSVRTLKRLASAMGMALKIEFVQN